MKNRICAQAASSVLRERSYPQRVKKASILCQEPKLRMTVWTVSKGTTASSVSPQLTLTNVPLVITALLARTCPSSALRVLTTEKSCPLPLMTAKSAQKVQLATRLELATTKITIALQVTTARI